MQNINIVLGRHYEAKGVSFATTILIKYILGSWQKLVLLIKLDIMIDFGYGQYKTTNQHMAI